LITLADAVCISGDFTIRVDSLGFPRTVLEMIVKPTLDFIGTSDHYVRWNLDGAGPNTQVSLAARY
jgi:hypothetical protein